MGRPLNSGGSGVPGFRVLRHRTLHHSVVYTTSVLMRFFCELCVHLVCTWGQDYKLGCCASASVTVQHSKKSILPIPVSEFEAKKNEREIDSYGQDNYVAEKQELSHRGSCHSSLFFSSLGRRFPL